MFSIVLDRFTSCMFCAFLYLVFLSVEGQSREKGSVCIIQSSCRLVKMLVDVVEGGILWMFCLLVLGAIGCFNMQSYLYLNAAIMVLMLIRMEMQ